jgi:predicted ATPase/DNA-binding SARP family transcriptional activator
VTADVQIEVLGPLRITRSGDVMELGGRRQRTLLAALVVEAGAMVSAERLTDRVWGTESLPANPRATLRTYLSRLRQSLGRDDAIVAGQTGWQLDPAGLSTDADRFEGFVEDAKEPGLDVHRRLDLLDAALGLWRGTAYDDLADEYWVRGEAERLEELRVTAAERRFGAMLAAGKHTDALPGLTAASGAHPLRDRLVGLRMLALYLSGRQAEASRVFQDHRAYLLDELGLEPGFELVDLDRRILAGDQSLLVERSVGRPPRGYLLEEKAVDAVPGNLPVPASSFVGRASEVRDLVEIVTQHRFVTLTGVGGVGKTRLAIEVAAELKPDFGDGVWLVELAPVGDGGAVPDAVATALGVTPQAGRSVTESVVETLAGRRLLVVLDNCEHVLDAAADLIEAILARSTRVSVIATGREGLGIDGEHLWPVPCLEFAQGAESAAVELFLERARAVAPAFALDDDADLEAVLEICRRLDGIALAIELAAARMGLMTPAEVLARLRDRFRLLSGSRRGLERHQTLRQAVQWSYDLLTRDEQTVLGVCSVFAGGFDVAALTAVCDRFDEYTILEVLDSLVRKSLVMVSHAGGRSRYGLLETIRQFNDEVGVASGAAADLIGEIGEVRHRHSRFFAERAIAHWDVRDKTGIRDATDWVEVEFDNLRAGFRWAVDRSDLVTATAIAAHTAIIAFSMQKFEPVGWAEELLPAATAAELPQLPRLCTAAGICSFVGRPEDAVSYAEVASGLQTDPRYQPFGIRWNSFIEGTANLIGGRIDRYLEICTALAEEAGPAQVVGLSGLTAFLPLVGRAGEAIAIADDAMAAARTHANPFWSAFAYWAYGRAFNETDPTRALDALRIGLAYGRDHRLPLWEAAIARDAAGLEAVHGDLDQALDLFTTSLDSFHRAGNTANLASTLASVIVFFDRINQPEVAATIYGVTGRYPNANQAVGFAAAVDHVRDTLDADMLNDCVRAGAAMDLADAVRYAQDHINATRRHRPRE